MHRPPPGFLPHPGMNGMGPHLPPPPSGPMRPWPMPPMPAGLRPGMPPPMPPPLPPQQQLNVHVNNLRRRPESEYMGADEIDSILRIQWKSLHNGPPYLEDYYYQVRWMLASVWLPLRCTFNFRAH